MCSKDRTQCCLILSPPLPLPPPPPPPPLPPLPPPHLQLYHLPLTQRNVHGKEL